MEINKNAAAQYEESITINAPIAKVWGLLSDIQNWPSWNPDVKSVDLQGQVSVGTTFVWKSGPSTITSRLEEVVAPTRIVWTGKTMSIKAVHVYTLQEQNGQTIVTTAESFEGLLATLLKGMMRKTLAESGHAGLEHLKRASELNQEVAE